MGELCGLLEWDPASALHPTHSSQHTACSHGASVRECMHGASSRTQGGRRPAWTSCALDARLMHGRELARTHAVHTHVGLGFAFKPQLLAPQRAQVSLKLRVRRGSLLSGCGRGTGEERVPACAGEERLGCRARSARSAASVASAAPAYARGARAPTTWTSGRPATDGFELIG